MNFDFKPILENDLIRLQPLQESDFERLYAVASDPLVWAIHPSKDRYQRPVFQSYFDSGIASGSAFLVLNQTTGEVIGSSRYHGLDTINSEIEIGWTFLARSHWGGQYNRAMKDLMMRHAYQFVDNIVFHIGEGNWRSRRAVEKIGGVLIVVEQNPHVEFRAGSVVYRIKKQDFNGLDY